MEKLKEAISLIAYDGGFGRANTPNRTRAMLKKVCAKFPAEHVKEVDHLLSSLNEEAFETVCIGDQDEAAKLLHSYIGGRVNEILEYVFEGDHGL